MLTPFFPVCVTPLLVVWCAQLIMPKSIKTGVQNRWDITTHNQIDTCIRTNQAGSLLLADLEQEFFKSSTSVTTDTVVHSLDAIPTFFSTHQKRVRATQQPPRPLLWNLGGKIGKLINFALRSYQEQHLLAGPRTYINKKERQPGEHRSSIFSQQIKP